MLKLSPTAVACFRQCPRQYRFRYVDHLGDEYGGPRPYFTMGNHVHDTLREFLTMVPLERRNMDTMTVLLRKKWRRYRVGFRGPEDERRWAEKALRQLASFVTAHDVKVRPYLVEASLEARITASLVLQARIDRVDLEVDGTLHVIDYKTGNTPESSDWTQLHLNALGPVPQKPPPRHQGFILLPVVGDHGHGPRLPGGPGPGQVGPPAHRPGHRRREAIPGPSGDALPPLRFPADLPGGGPDRQREGIGSGPGEGGGPRRAPGLGPGAGPGRSRPRSGPTRWLRPAAPGAVVSTVFAGLR